MAANEEVVGMVVKLASESTDFQNQMNTLNRQMRVLQSDYKATVSASKDFDNTLDGNKAKIEYLSKAIETQASIVEAHSSRVEKTNAKLSDLAQAQSTLKEKLDAAKSSYQDIVASQGEESEAAQKLKEELKDLQSEYDKGNTKINNTVKTLDNQTINVNKAKEKLNVYNNELSDTKEKLEQLSNQGSTSSSVFDAMKEKMKDTASNTKILGVSLTDLVGGFNGGEVASVALGTALGTLASAGIDIAIQAFVKLIASVGEFMASAVEVGATFEAQMSKVKAISGATEGDMSKLTNVAREFGSSTQYSATEAAQALEYMSLAGWNAQQSSEALGGVLDLAAASAMELSKASDVVTDYLTAFNLEADQAGHLADVMAYAMSHSNTSTEQLAEAYKNCASTAATFGMSLEETTAWLGKMADSGLKAGESGTTLNAILARIYGQNDNAVGALKEYNIAIFDAMGNAREFTDIMEDMQVAMSNMTDEQKDLFMKSVAGTNQLSGFAIMCNTATSEVDKLANAMANSAGTASKMAQTMNDNVAGLKTSIDSKLSDIKISLYNNIEPILKAILSMVNTILNGLTQFLEPITSLSNAIGAPLATVISSIMRIIELLQNTLIPLFSGPISLITSVIRTIGTGLQNIYSIIDTICSGIESFVEPVVNALKNIGHGIENVFSSLSNFADFVTKIIETINVFIEQLVSKWGDLVGVITSAAQFDMSGLVTHFNSLKNTFSDMSGAMKSVWNGSVKDINSMTSELESNTKQSFSNIADACGLGASHVFSSFEEMYSNIQKLDNDTFGQLKENANEYFNEYELKMKVLDQYESDTLQERMKKWEESHKSMEGSMNYYIQKAEYQAKQEERLARETSSKREQIETSYTSKLEKELQTRSDSLNNYANKAYQMDYTSFAENEEKKTKKVQEEVEKRNKLGNSSGVGSILSGLIKSYAVGTQFHSGGLAIVGDDANGHGELVNMRAGSQVHRNEESKSMLKAANKDIEVLLAATLNEIRSLKQQQTQTYYREIAEMGLI
nr:phage tail tape measure protein [uncultured Cellulosilyticum sp.]